jgi:lysozyme family protein
VADELSSGALLNPPLDIQPLAPATTIGSEAFRQADAFTAKHEGGYTANDGTGHIANMGIDQTAHPELDVSKLTPLQAQAIRYGYWQAVNGDALAQKDSRLALVAYDTAMASGSAHAQELLQQSGGDPTTMLQLQTNFMQSLAQRNPEKYGPVLQVWMNRQRDLAQTIGAGAPTQTTANSPQPSLEDTAAASLQTLATQQQKTAAAPVPKAVPKTPVPVSMATMQPVAPIKGRTINDEYLELLKRSPAGA